MFNTKFAMLDAVNEIVFQNGFVKLVVQIKIAFA